MFWNTYLDPCANCVDRHGLSSGAFVKHRPIRPWYAAALKSLGRAEIHVRRDRQGFFADHILQCQAKSQRDYVTSARLFPSARDLVVSAHRRTDATAEIIVALGLQQTPLILLRSICVGFRQEILYTRLTEPRYFFPVISSSCRSPDGPETLRLGVAFRKCRPISMYTALICITKLNWFLFLLGCAQN